MDGPADGEKNAMKKNLFSVLPFMMTLTAPWQGASTKVVRVGNSADVGLDNRKPRRFVTPFSQKSLLGKG